MTYEVLKNEMHCALNSLWHAGLSNQCNWRFFRVQSEMSW